MVTVLWICGSLTVLGVVMTVWAILWEKRDYNKGYCKRCGYPLKLFDRDSQCGRGYICKKCDYVTWISYTCVDKNHGKRRNDV